VRAWYCDSGDACYFLLVSSTDSTEYFIGNNTKFISAYNYAMKPL
jgi:hypothetical protein